MVTTVVTIIEGKVVPTMRISKRLMVKVPVPTVGTSKILTAKVPVPTMGTSKMTNCRLQDSFDLLFLIKFSKNQKMSRSGIFDVL